MQDAFRWRHPPCLFSYFQGCGEPNAAAGSASCIEMLTYDDMPSLNLQRIRSR
jgi:hypothetical protein